MEEKPVCFTEKRNLLEEVDVVEIAVPFDNSAEEKEAVCEQL